MPGNAVPQAEIDDFRASARGWEKFARDSIVFLERRQALYAELRDRMSWLSQFYYDAETRGDINTRFDRAIDQLKSNLRALDREKPVAPGHNVR
jgi:hypothetical protein